MALNIASVEVLSKVFVTAGEECRSCCDWVCSYHKAFLAELFFFFGLFIDSLASFGTSANEKVHESSKLDTCKFFTKTLLPAKDNVIKNSLGRPVFLFCQVH